jgi:hypothetical protein
MTDPRPYYPKFIVTRTETGEVVNEDTFTLIPAHDRHAIYALRAYADACWHDNPALADDLRALALRHERAHEEGSSA